jgi:hypothetical protein
MSDAERLKSPCTASEFGTVSLFRDNNPDINDRCGSLPLNERFVALASNAEEMSDGRL